MPAHGAGINEALLYTVTPFIRKLNADELFIKYVFVARRGAEIHEIWADINWASVRVHP